MIYMWHGIEYPSELTLASHIVPTDLTLVSHIVPTDLILASLIVPTDHTSPSVILSFCDGCIPPNKIL